MLNRRDFARLSVVAAAAPLIGATANKPPIIKPKRLSPGDTVGLVLPATAAFEADEIQFAKEQMEAIGFKVVIGAHAFDKWGYFAGHDKDRADDINRMFGNDEINAVVCYTGGWGSPRVLPYLDYDLIKRKPKVLIGYSDITALLNAVHKKTGLITFHGPVGGSTFDPFTLENFRRVVMTPEPAGLLPTPSKKPNELIDRTNRILKITPGKATGRLIGGNLTMIATLMGTPYQPDTSGAIVFLEDVHEEPYRIDRMLTTLALGGMFAQAAGIIFGRCSDCGVKGPSLSLEEILRDRFGSLPIPAIAALSFGHLEQKPVLLMGALAALDADAGTVRVA